MAGARVPDELAALVAMTVAAARGDQAAADQLAPVVAGLAGEQDWAALADRLRRILAGERGPALAGGLDPTDTAVITAILDQLDQLDQQPANAERWPPAGHATRRAGDGDLGRVWCPWRCG